MFKNVENLSPVNHAMKATPFPVGGGGIIKPGSVGVAQSLHDGGGRGHDSVWAVNQLNTLNVYWTVSVVFCVVVVFMVWNCMVVALHPAWNCMKLHLNVVALHPAWNDMKLHLMVVSPCLKWYETALEFGGLAPCLKWYETALEFGEPCTLLEMVGNCIWIWCQPTTPLLSLQNAPNLDNSLKIYITKN